MHKFYKYLGIIFSLSLNTNLFAKNTPTVNILTWFGYLNVPEITEIIEKECNVTISYDEYYSNEEFLRRWKAHNDSYDILIFANLLYKGLADQIAVNNANLNPITKHYHPVVKQHYDHSNYPKNIVYFSHSLMGFLWNPENLTLSETDDMFTVFKKAKNKRVILIDDPVEVQNMINLAFGDKNKAVLNLENMQSLVQSSQVTLSNDYNKIYESPDFAFSYLWSGEAVIDAQKSDKPYQFLMHPKTSFICTDLLSVTNNNPSSICVAKVLTSRKVMDILQNVNYYFSPYGDFSQVSDPMFRKIYQKTFSALANFSWVEPVPLAEFNQLTHIWKALKLEISKKQNA